MENHQFGHSRKQERPQIHSGDVHRRTIPLRPLPLHDPPFQPGAFLVGNVHDSGVSVPFYPHTGGNLVAESSLHNSIHEVTFRHNLLHRRHFVVRHRILQPPQANGGDEVQECGQVLLERVLRAGCGVFVTDSHVHISDAECGLLPLRDHLFAEGSPTSYFHSVLV
jgi:hypothetical protein